MIALGLLLNSIGGLTTELDFSSSCRPCNGKLEDYHFEQLDLARTYGVRVFTFRRGSWAATRKSRLADD